MTVHVPAPSENQTSDRTERYLARVDEHLQAIEPRERLPFLKDQNAGWERHYAEWRARIDNGTATKADLKCDAFDFSLTIAGLAMRIKQTEQVQ